jgi:hypothetical protein
MSRPDRGGSRARCRPRSAPSMIRNPQITTASDGGVDRLEEGCGTRDGSCQCANGPLSRGGSVIVLHQAGEAAGPKPPDSSNSVDACRAVKTRARRPPAPIDILNRRRRHTTARRPFAHVGLRVPRIDDRHVQALEVSRIACSNGGAAGLGNARYERVTQVYDAARPLPLGGELSGRASSQ